MSNSPNISDLRIHGAMIGTADLYLADGRTWGGAVWSSERSRYFPVSSITPDPVHNDATTANQPQVLALIQNDDRYTGIAAYPCWVAGPGHIYDGFYYLIRHDDPHDYHDDYQVLRAVRATIKPDSHNDAHRPSYLCQYLSTGSRRGDWLANLPIKTLYFAVDDVPADLADAIIDHHLTPAYALDAHFGVQQICASDTDPTETIVYAAGNPDPQYPEDLMIVVNGINLVHSHGRLALVGNVAYEVKTIAKLKANYILTLRRPHPDWTPRWREWLDAQLPALAELRQQHFLKLKTEATAKAVRERRSRFYAITNNNDHNPFGSSPEPLVITIDDVEAGGMDVATVTITIDSTASHYNNPSTDWPAAPTPTPAVYYRTRVWNLDVNLSQDLLAYTDERPLDPDGAADLVIAILQAYDVVADRDATRHDYARITVRHGDDHLLDLGWEYQNLSAALDASCGREDDCWYYSSPDQDAAFEDMEADLEALSIICR